MSIRIEVNPGNWLSFKPGKWRRGFEQGVRGSLRNRRRTLGTLIVGFLTFSLTVFSANPGYSIQMLFSGLEYWPIAFMTRFTGLLMNSGYTGAALTLIFSLLVGITMTNTAVQLKMNKLNLSSLGALPGFLAGGCASCGVGILSLLGFGGVLASMPFAGNSLRLAGVLLLVALIIRTGNPDLCEI
ncbi:MAG: hypothetical protein ACLFTA_00885 [Candidatus Nanohaloarchaea archaeon]